MTDRRLSEMQTFAGQDQIPLLVDGLEHLEKVQVRASDAHDGAPSLNAVHYAIAQTSIPFHSLAAHYGYHYWTGGEP